MMIELNCYARFYVNAKINMTLKLLKMNNLNNLQEDKRLCALLSRNLNVAKDISAIVEDLLQDSYK